MSFKHSLFSVFPSCLSRLLARLLGAQLSVRQAAGSGGPASSDHREPSCGAGGERCRAGSELLVLAVPAAGPLARAVGMGWLLEQRSSLPALRCRGAGKGRRVGLGTASNRVFHPNESTQPKCSSGLSASHGWVLKLPYKQGFRGAEQSPGVEFF